MNAAGRSRRRRSAAAIVAIGAALVAAAPAFAKPRAIKVTGTYTSTTSTATRLMFTENLYRTFKGRRFIVGGDSFVCIRLAPGRVNCRGRTIFADGSILTQGIYTRAVNNRMDITGGTGAYRNAHGHLSLHNLTPMGNPTGEVYYVR